MNAATKLAVRERALDRCEYRRLPQSAQPYVTFHVEHILSRKHRGTDGISQVISKLVSGLDARHDVGSARSPSVASDVDVPAF